MAYRLNPLFVSTSTGSAVGCPLSERRFPDLRLSSNLPNLFYRVHFSLFGF